MATSVKASFYSRDLQKGSPTRTFPDIIVASNLANSNVLLHKLYPHLGLGNEKEKISADLDLSDLRPEKMLHMAIKKFLDGFRGKANLNKKRGVELLRLSTSVYILEMLSARLHTGENLIIKGNEIRLATPILSYNGKVLITAKTDVVRCVRQAFSYCEHIEQGEIIEIKNLEKQLSNLQICFSSAHVEGAWDLATMSMRGIKSCMRWGSAQSPHLVGSIADPGCGILYLTNGSRTAYGSKMLFRSLVRILWSPKEEKGALLVDRVYSSFYKSRPGHPNKIDEQVSDLFVSYLQKKLPNSTVLSAGKHKKLLLEYRLPQVPRTVRQYLGNGEHSYCDTPLPRDVQEPDLHVDKLLASLLSEKKVASKKVRKSVKKKGKSENKQRIFLPEIIYPGIQGPVGMLGGNPQGYDWDDGEEEIDEDDEDDDDDDDDDDGGDDDDDDDDDDEDDDVEEEVDE